jgi:hypothetical protein
MTVRDKPTTRRRVLEERIALLRIALRCDASDSDLREQLAQAEAALRAFDRAERGEVRHDRR